MDDASRDVAAKTEQFVRLLGEHERHLVAYILALVPDWHAAHDIAQDTRVRLWQQFDKYDPTKDFGVWSRTIAHYLVLQYRTREGRQKVRFSDTLLALVAEDAGAAAVESDARQDALAGCLQKVSDTERDLLIRWHADDAAQQQIARETDKPYETVRKQLYRLRVRLRNCIEATLAREDAP